MIKEIRNQLAGEQVKEFVKKMKDLGFDREDIIDLLTKETGGESA